MATKTMKSKVNSDIEKSHNIYNWFALCFFMKPGRYGPCLSPCMQNWSPQNPDPWMSNTKFFLYAERFYIQCRSWMSVCYIIVLFVFFHYLLWRLLHLVSSPFLVPLKAIQFLFFLIIHRSSFLSNEVSLLQPSLIFHYSYEKFACLIVPYWLNSIVEIIFISLIAILFSDTVTETAIIFQMSNFRLIWCKIKTANIFQRFLQISIKFSTSYWQLALINLLSPTHWRRVSLTWTGANAYKYL